MTTGIEISLDSKDIFEELCELKMHRYVILSIEQQRVVKVEVVGDREADYDQFLADLCKGGPKACRYAIYDYAYEHQCQGCLNTCVKEKIFFMLWCPGQAHMKDKMLYATSYAAVKRQFIGIRKCIQATDLSEAGREYVEDQLRFSDSD